MLIENVIKASDISGKAGAGPVSVSPETTLLDVTQVLAGNKMGVVLVLDTADKVIGVLSERDIIASIAKHGEKALQMPAETVMTRDVKTCSPHDNPKDVINTMSTGRFRHMPIIVEGRLTGLVSSSDILKYMSNHMTPDEQFNIWVKSLWI